MSPIVKKKRAAAKKPAPARKAATHPSHARARPALQKKTAAPLARLREVCFSLPEVTEKEAWGEPTFRVREKMFAMFATDHHHDGNIAVWCKAPMGMQEILVESDPDRFFRPPYVGPKGWIGIRLHGRVKWQEVRSLLAESWRMTAPKKLADTLPPGDG
jgi:hypothetical protein